MPLLRFLLSKFMSERKDTPSAEKMYLGYVISMISAALLLVTIAILTSGKES